MASTSEAEKRAHSKYIHEKIDEMKVRLPKGEKAIFTKYATINCESLNTFAIRALYEAMERDGTGRKNGER